MSWLRVAATGAGILGFISYYFCCSDVSARKVMFWGTLITVGITSTSLLLYTGVSQQVGIPNEVFLLVDDSVANFASDIISIPVLAIVAIMCPTGMEATVFCFYTSLQNIAITLSSDISAGLMAAYGITSHNFDNIVQLRVLTLALQLIPCALVWLLPSEEELDEIVRNQRKVFSACLRKHKMETREPTETAGLPQGGKCKE